MNTELKNPLPGAATYTRTPNEWRILSMSKVQNEQEYICIYNLRTQWNQCSWFESIKKQLWKFARRQKHITNYILFIIIFSALIYIWACPLLRLCFWPNAVIVLSTTSADCSVIMKWSFCFRGLLRFCYCLMMNRIQWPDTKEDIHKVKFVPCNKILPVFVIRAVPSS